MDQSWDGYPWFVPRAFNPHDLRYFTAFSNVHTLGLQDFKIPHFMPNIELYFGHFSQTLQSLTLYRSRWTSQQLSHFLSLLPNLNNIELCDSLTLYTEPEKLVPLSTPAPKLRGRLALYGPHMDETWTYIIASSGGLWFHHVDLRNATSSAPVLLGACAETLETLRFNVADGSKPF